MKRIEAFEQAIESKTKSVKEIGNNLTLFWAYCTSIESGNDLINFDENIWIDEIEDIANFMKANGIVEFTISSSFSNLIPTLAEFEKHGFKMAGLTTVNARYNAIGTNEKAKLKAIRMLNY